MTRETQLIENEIKQAKGDVTAKSEGVSCQAHDSFKRLIFLQADVSIMILDAMEEIREMLRKQSTPAPETQPSGATISAKGKLFGFSISNVNQGNVIAIVALILMAVMFGGMLYSNAQAGKQREEFRARMEASRR
jgi:hypothetical protein